MAKLLLFFQTTNILSHFFQFFFREEIITLGGGGAESAGGRFIYIDTGALNPSALSGMLPFVGAAEAGSLHSMDYAASIAKSPRALSAPGAMVGSGR